MFNKLFTKILDSSIWLEPLSTRIVWITLIATMDEDGYAHFAAIENLARRAGVTLEECEKAVACFLSPDPNSSDPAFEGKRAERVPGGFVILNAQKYRNTFNRVTQMEMNRIRVQRFRSKKSHKKITSPLHPITRALPRITPVSENASVSVQGEGAGRGNGNPSSSSVYALKTVMEAKRAMADQLKNKHASEVSTGLNWNDPVAKKQYLELRKQVNKIQGQIGGMA